MDVSRADRCLVAIFATFALTEPVASQTPSLAIVGATVVDVADGRLIQNATVVVTGDTITSVTPGGAPPNAVRVISGEGKFLIPGLWDMHAHMETGGEAWLPLYVANGVTGIRDMGSDLDLILRMRESIASRRQVGPRIFAAGPILDDAPGEWPLRMRVKTPQEGRAAVQLLKRRGTDLIKVHDHTPRDVFFAIADEARRQRLLVAGHVPLKVTIEEAIEAGQTNIEHLSNIEIWESCSGGDDYRPEPCRSFFEMLGRMSPLAALRTATINPARYFGLEGTTGSVAPGKRADLVLLDANSLTDIGNVRRIHAVVVAGRMLERTELDQLLAKVKAAARSG